MRTFIAVELEERLRLGIGAQLSRLRRVAPAARWVRPDTLHLTLAFLGEMADSAVTAVGHALAQVASRHRPFTLRPRGHGTFGALECPKVLWVGLGGDLRAVEALQADLARELATLGYPPDFTQYEPHLTLARSKHPRGDPALARCAAALGDTPFAEQPVHEVVLFSSESDREGMRYAAIGRCRLGPP